MLRRTRRKMGIALILFVVAAVMMIQLALATITENVSVWLIGAGVLVMLAAMFVFGKYFRE